MKKYKNSASDCFAHQKFLLNIFGFLPNDNILYKFYSISLLIVSTIYPFTIIPEIIKVYFADFNDFIFCMLFGIGHFTCMINMHIVFWNRFELIRLFEKLDVLDEMSNSKNGVDGNVFMQQYKDLVRKQGYFGSALPIVVITAYSSLSIVLSLNAEKWILPFGSGAAFVNDNIQIILQVILFGVLALILYLEIFIYINVLTVICGHCKLLQKFVLAISITGNEREILKECDSIATRKETIDWESFMVQLRQIVPYHIGIIDAADTLETIFSLVIFTFFGGIGIALCLFIYHSQLNVEIVNTLIDLIGLLAGYLLMIVISSYGEKIATESGKIASICYELDFANCDLRIQKSLILLILRSQRPITPTIGKLRALNLRTMLSVFQSIYTYYTFLRNMKGE